MKAEEAMNLLGAGRLVPADEHKVQQLVVSLKEELKTEYARIQPLKAQELMSAVESAIYCPAIIDAWANNPKFTKLHANTRPNADKWFDPLHNVSSAMAYGLSSLEGYVQRH